MEDFTTLRPQYKFQSLSGGRQTERFRAPQRQRVRIEAHRLEGCLRLSHRPGQLPSRRREVLAAAPFQNLPRMQEALVCRESQEGKRKALSPNSTATSPSSPVLTPGSTLSLTPQPDWLPPSWDQQGNCALPSAPGPETRLRVAVDIDEVLGVFLKSLIGFCEEEYCVYHDLEEFHVYDFKQIWKCSQAEANHRVHQFFASRRFKEGLPIIPGAWEVLNQLSPHCDFVIVTSRQHVIQEPTLEWLEAHYPGLFKEVFFGNHFALEGKSKPKAEICREVGATVLIDDNPRYAIECAGQGIRVLLFDWELSYAWSKTEDGPTHELITRVKDWKEVEGHLLQYARTVEPLP